MSLQSAAAAAAVMCQILFLQKYLRNYCRLKKPVNLIPQFAIGISVEIS
jgi:hypothetical protein